MRLILAFFVLVSVSTPAVACISALEPSLDWMIKGSTLIVRGQSSGKSHQYGESRQGEPTSVRSSYRASICECAASRHSGQLEGVQPLPTRFSQEGRLRPVLLARQRIGICAGRRGIWKLAVSNWQDASQSPDPFVAIERDLRRAIQNDSGRQRIDDVLLLSSLGRPKVLRGGPSGANKSDEVGMP